MRQPLHSRRRFLALAMGGAAAARRSAAEAQGDEVDALIAAMTPPELAARMFVLPIAGTALTADEDARLRALKPGGVILVGGNFGAPDEVRALVAALHATNPGLPPLVALDQEGGIVAPVGEDPVPGAPTLGQFPPAEIATLARARADLLADYGFDVNLAPVADVALRIDSFMAGRVFGSDPVQVAEAVEAYLGGVVDSGVLHCVKHFPGHGRVAVDSHLALPVLDVDAETWWAQDALPFRAALAAGVPMVMLGHLTVPAWDVLPASLSPAAVRILRRDLGFRGVVVSDDLGMGALGQWDPFRILDLAVAAGNDVLLHVVLRASQEELVAHVAGRIESGELARERVSQSVGRVLRMQFGRARA